MYVVSIKINSQILSYIQFIYMVLKADHSFNLTLKFNAIVIFWQEADLSKLRSLEKNRRMIGGFSLPWSFPNPNL